MEELILAHQNEIRLDSRHLTPLYEGATLENMNYQDIISIEPGKRSGKPCIRGLRITVSDVLEYLAAGMSTEEIIADFPELTVDDIRACLAFAAEKDRRLLSA